MFSILISPEHLNSDLRFSCALGNCSSYRCSREQNKSYNTSCSSAVVTFLFKGQLWFVKNLFFTFEWCWQLHPETSNCNEATIFKNSCVFYSPAHDLSTLAHSSIVLLGRCTCVLAFRFAIIFCVFFNVRALSCWQISLHTKWYRQNLCPLVWPVFWSKYTIIWLKLILE